MALVVQRRFSWKQFGLAVRFVLFAAVYYFFMSLWVDPRIIYDRYIPVSQGFSRTSANLVAMLQAPGGAVEYAAGSLHQYYCYNWLGSLIITAVAVLICVAVDRLLPVKPNSWFRLVSFVPPLVLLVPYCRYNDPLQAALGLLTALAVANLYVRIVRRSVVVRVILLLVLAAAVYYLAGLMCLVLVGVCVALEVWQRLFRPQARTEQVPSGKGDLFCRTDVDRRVGPAIGCPGVGHHRQRILSVQPARARGVRATGERELPDALLPPQQEVGGVSGTGRQILHDRVRQYGPQQP